MQYSYIVHPTIAYRFFLFFLFVFFVPLLRLVVRSLWIYCYSREPMIRYRDILYSVNLYVAMNSELEREIIVIYYSEDTL